VRKQWALWSVPSIFRCIRQICEPIYVSDTDVSLLQHLSRDGKVFSPIRVRLIRGIGDQFSDARLNDRLGAFDAWEPRDVYRASAQRYPDARCVKYGVSAWQLQIYLAPVKRECRSSRSSRTPRGRPLNPVERTSLSGPTITAPTRRPFSILHDAKWCARSINLSSHFLSRKASL
jgi:hypothetical protein